jgi:hypothetical protein
MFFERRDSLFCLLFPVLDLVIIPFVAMLSECVDSTLCLLFPVLDLVIMPVREN